MQRARLSSQQVRSSKAVLSFRTFLNNKGEPRENGAVKESERGDNPLSDFVLIKDVGK